MQTYFHLVSEIFCLRTHFLYSGTAVNIMSTFVHNEPTSLAVIQEAGLPELFYKAIEIGIEPAIEVGTCVYCRILD